MQTPNANSKMQTPKCKLQNANWKYNATTNAAQSANCTTAQTTNANYKYKLQKKWELQTPNAKL